MPTVGARRPRTDLPLPLPAPGTDPGQGTAQDDDREVAPPPLPNPQPTGGEIGPNQDSPGTEAWEDRPAPPPPPAGTEGNRRFTNDQLRYLQELAARGNPITSSRAQAVLRLVEEDPERWRARPAPEEPKAIDDAGSGGGGGGQAGGGGGAGGGAPAGGAKATAPGPGLGGGPKAAPGPGTNSEFEGRMLALLERMLGGDLSRYSQPVVDSMKADLFRATEGRRAAGSARLKEDAAGRGRFRQPFAGREVGELERHMGAEYGAGVRQILQKKAEADYEDRVAALDRAQKWLDSQRQYIIATEQNARERDRLLAEIALGYARIDSELKIAQIQATKGAGGGGGPSIPSWFYEYVLNDGGGGDSGTGSTVPPKKK